LNHACSGYIYALGLASSLIRTDLATNALVVTADTYSKFINPRDRSARLLFGDGATATWVAAEEPKSLNRSGIHSPTFGTAGNLHDKFIVPAGGCRLPKSSDTKLEAEDESGNFRSAENIHMAGRDILNFVSTKIPSHVSMTLEKQQLAIADIDLFIFHQASGIVLDLLTRLLRLPAEKVFRHLELVGNTVSSSIPLALRAALDSNRAKPGDRVFLCGFGVGLSWGSTIVEL
jgi:3-oxoacyl-[acyl-carrier-protein] synthase-3